MDEATNRSVDWAAVQQAYERGRGSVLSICAEFGVTKGTLAYRAQRYRWIPRRATRKGGPELAVHQLYRLLETKLGVDPETINHKEVAQVINTIKSLSEMAARADAAATPSEAEKKDKSDRRRKLVKRIADFQRR